MSVNEQAWFNDQVLVHEPALRSYLRQYLRQPTDIEDCIQETYARVLSMTDASRAAVRNWRAFMFTTARNVGLNQLRRQRVISLDTIAELDASGVLLDEGPPTYEEVNSRQELTLLGGAISALPERCRQVFTLRKLYGLSQKQIAARLGIAENTVEQHIAKAVRLVTRSLFEPALFAPDNVQANCAEGRAGGARGTRISSGQHQD